VWLHWLQGLRQRITSSEWQLIVFPLLLTLLSLTRLLCMAAWQSPDDCVLCRRSLFVVVATYFVRCCRRALDIRIAYLLAANLLPPYIVCLYRSSALFEDIGKGRRVWRDAVYHDDMWKLWCDDVTHDTSLTVMVLLLPCISVERASNIVPFNAGSLMFHYEGSSNTSRWWSSHGCIYFFVASFLRKKAWRKRR